MQGKRYPEGGDSVPELSFGSTSDKTVIDDLKKQRRIGYIVPNKVKDARSSTSQALDCFVKREFSEKLQKFMLSYSYTLVTTPVLSGEV